MVNPKESYNVHWPMRRGSLNVHSGPGGSLSAILQDLEDIWVTVLATLLNIPRADIKVCLRDVAEQTNYFFFDHVQFLFYFSLGFSRFGWIFQEEPFGNNAAVGLLALAFLEPIRHSF